MYIKTMTKPSAATIQAWTGLIRAQKGALHTVETALKQNDLPPLIWYDVLFELEGAGNNGLRPYELERQLLLPQYGVSRVVERIENSGYLKRETCEEDGRGQRLKITPAGKTLRRRMWSIYGPAIEDAIGENLTPKQATTLSGLLEKLID